MNKQDLTNLFNTVKDVATKRSPEILTGLGIAGMITTTVLAVKATPKALRLIDDLKQDRAYDQEVNGITIPTTKWDMVKVAWKPYIPAVITGVASTACLIGASSVNLRRNAALATAYQISTTALADYKEQVVETIGEKKEKNIREKVAQKKVDEMQIDKSTIVITGAGDTLFVEPVTRQPFTSDIETVRRVINDLNYRMVVGMEEYISLSEFFDEFPGLEKTDITDDLGWNIGSDGPIDCEFHATMTREGKPALMLDYRVAPRRKYMDLM